MLPSRRPCSRPGEGRRAVGEHQVQHALGQPGRLEQLEQRQGGRGRVLGRLHTTVLPATSAGTRYHDGTATGKLPAVTTAAAPTGTRNVNSCLSGISLGTVWPYSRRPSPRKKSQVSMISWTSPSASPCGLAQLAGDQAGQGLLVGLDDPADRGDRPAAHRRRGRGPGWLRPLGLGARRRERGGVGQLHLGDDVGQPGRVG